jgi:hypothetical protein
LTRRSFSEGGEFLHARPGFWKRRVVRRTKGQGAFSFGSFSLVRAKKMNKDYNRRIAKIQPDFPPEA